MTVGACDRDCHLMAVGSRLGARVTFKGMASPGEQGLSASLTPQRFSTNGNQASSQLLGDMSYSNHTKDGPCDKKCPAEPHISEYWSPFGGTVWEVMELVGGETLLEEVI